MNNHPGIGHNQPPEITETASKKRRGRPPVIPPEMATVYRSLWPDMTDRQRQNEYFAQEATVALGLIPDTGAPPDPLTGPFLKYRWLVDWEKADANKRGGRKRSVLAELGRLYYSHGKEALVDVAVQVCELQFSTKKTVDIVRHHRTGKSAKPSVAAMADTIAKAVDRYMQSHPDATWQEMDAAILDVHDRLMRMKGE